MKQRLNSYYKKAKIIVEIEDNKELMNLSGQN